MSEIGSGEKCAPACSSPPIVDEEVLQQAVETGAITEPAQVLG